MTLPTARERVCAVRSSLASRLMEMMGVGQEGMKPKATVAVAADAFVEAGKQQAARRRSS